MYDVLHVQFEHASNHNQVDYKSSQSKEVAKHDTGFLMKHYSHILEHVASQRLQKQQDPCNRQVMDTGYLLG